MTPRLCRLSLAAASLAAASSIAGLALAQPFPPGAPDQSRDVAGWLVEFGGESDGGIMVRMTRGHARYRLEYYVAFWRGNAGPYSGAAVEGPQGPCGGESWQRDPQVETDLWRAETDLPGVARTVRTRLADLLAGCGASTAEAEAALAGFDPAFRQASDWAELGRLETLAEIEAIVNYGADTGSEVQAADPQ